MTKRAEKITEYYNRLSSMNEESDRYLRLLAEFKVFLSNK